MNSWIKFCLKNPVGVFVCAIFLLLFGYIALSKIPYQLLPQVTHPVVSVYTIWKGATPYEIEKEITQRQEKTLKNTPNLLAMTSTSKEGMAIINLEFAITTDMKTALLNISSRLDEVRGYPADVEKPIIKPTGENIPISVYLFAKSINPHLDINTAKNFINDEILKYYERIEGVGEVYVSGGRKKQIFITLDTQKLAFFHITMDEVIASIKKQNVNISAGSMDFFQRSYRISTNGEYTSLDAIRNTVVKTIDHKNILLRDLASVSEGYEKLTSYNVHNGSNVISLQIRPTASANILDLTNRVEKLTHRLNEDFLKKRGIVMEWGRDQRQYIKSSISLMRENIFVGILLAIGVLFLFLRNLMSLVVISLVIPLSIMGSLIFLQAWGRTFNVISLAGISFAVSMIIDSAIVVLENILRQAKIQKNFFLACVVGTREVGGALFASSVTTIAIFVPIIFVKDDAGRLFVDIALASSSIILLSLLVCFFMIPTFLYVLLKRSDFGRKKGKVDAFLVHLGRVLSFWIMQSVRFCVRNKKRQIITVVGFVGICSIFSYAAFPKTDYLPRGNQNFIFANLSIPPGLSLKEKKRILDALQADFYPFLLENHNSHAKIPAIKDFFISTGERVSFYLVSADKKKIPELMDYAQEKIDSIPNVRGSVLQQEIFSGASSSSIDINITGGNLDSISKTAGKLIASIKKNLPKVSISVVPARESNNQEINLYPDKSALALNGLNVESFGIMVGVILNGKKVGEYRKDEGILDMILDSKKSLKNDGKTSPEDIFYSQIYTPNGGVLPLNTLATIKHEYGVSRIRHFEQQRNILLILNIRDNTPVETLAQILQEKVIAPIAAESENDITLSGSAGKLQKLKTELLHGFLLAIVITYLILCALYGNFLYPFIIILTVPLATTGGLIGLYLVNHFIAKQNLDVLTMLGFIILVGSVVNNAILIVYQTLNNLKKMQPRRAVFLATKTRLAPIYMSMLTSVLALFPLVIFAGDGSEIYRGLGAILIGGMIFSTFITVLIIPALLLLCIKAKQKA